MMDASQILLQAALNDKTQLESYDFNRYLSMCKRIYDVPIAFLTFTPSHPSLGASPISYGLDLTSQNYSETIYFKDSSPVSSSSTKNENDIFIVLDAHTDERCQIMTTMSTNPSNQHHRSIRFYVRVPLIVCDVVIGNLCMIDDEQPRQSFSDTDQLNLKDISETISHLIQMRLDVWLRFQRENNLYNTTMSHHIRSSLMAAGLQMSLLHDNHQSFRKCVEQHQQPQPPLQPSLKSFTSGTDYTSLKNRLLWGNSNSNSGNTTTSSSSSSSSSSSQGLSRSQSISIKALKSSTGHDCHDENEEDPFKLLQKCDESINDLKTCLANIDRVTDFLLKDRVSQSTTASVTEDCILMDSGNNIHNSLNTRSNSISISSNSYKQQQQSSTSIRNGALSNKTSTSIAIPPSDSSSRSIHMSYNNNNNNKKNSESSRYNNTISIHSSKNTNNNNSNSNRYNNNTGAMDDMNNNTIPTTILSSSGNNIGKSGSSRQPSGMKAIARDVSALSMNSSDKIQRFDKTNSNTIHNSQLTNTVNSTAITTTKSPSVLPTRRISIEVPTSYNDNGQFDGNSSLHSHTHSSSSSSSSSVTLSPPFIHIQPTGSTSSCHHQLSSQQLFSYSPLSLHMSRILNNVSVMLPSSNINATDCCWNISDKLKDTLITRNAETIEYILGKTLSSLITDYTDIIVDITSTTTSLMKESSSNGSNNTMATASFDINQSINHTMKIVFSANQPIKQSTNFHTNSADGDDNDNATSTNKSEGNTTTAMTEMSSSTGPTLTTTTTTSSSTSSSSSSSSHSGTRNSTQNNSPTASPRLNHSNSINTTNHHKNISKTSISSSAAAKAALINNILELDPSLYKSCNNNDVTIINSSKTTNTEVYKCNGYSNEENVFTMKATQVLNTQLQPVHDELNKCQGVLKMSMFQERAYGTLSSLYIEIEVNLPFSIATAAIPTTTANNNSTTATTNNACKGFERKASISTSLSSLGDNHHGMTLPSTKPPRALAKPVMMVSTDSAAVTTTTTTTGALSCSLSHNSHHDEKDYLSQSSLLALTNNYNNNNTISNSNNSSNPTQPVLKEEPSLSTIIATIKPSPKVSQKSNKLRVLLVEDTPVIVKALTRSLEGLNCIVTAALDGEQGLALLKKNEYDIAFIDFLMPIMSGVEMMQAYNIWRDLQFSSSSSSSSMNEDMLFWGMSATACDYEQSQGILEGMHLFSKKAVSRNVMDYVLNICREHTMIESRLDVLLDDDTRHEEIVLSCRDDLTQYAVPAHTSLSSHSCKGTPRILCDAMLTTLTNRLFSFRRLSESSVQSSRSSKNIQNSNYISSRSGKAHNARSSKSSNGGHSSRNGSFNAGSHKNMSTSCKYSNKSNRSSKFQSNPSLCTDNMYIHNNTIDNTHTTTNNNNTMTTHCDRINEDGTTNQVNKADGSKSNSNSHIHQYDSNDGSESPVSFDETAAMLTPDDSFFGTNDITTNHTTTMMTSYMNSCTTGAMKPLLKSSSSELPATISNTHKGSHTSSSETPVHSLKRHSLSVTVGERLVQLTTNNNQIKSKTRSKKIFYSSNNSSCSNSNSSNSNSSNSSCHNNSSNNSNNNNDDSPTATATSNNTRFQFLRFFTDRRLTVKTASPQNSHHHHHHHYGNQILPVDS